MTEVRDRRGHESQRRRDPPSPRPPVPPSVDGETVPNLRGQRKEDAFQSELARPLMHAAPLE